MRPGVEGATRNAQYRVAPTSITPLAIHLSTVLGTKLPSGIEKHRFWIPLGRKTGKKRPRCFRACKQAGTYQNASQCAIPAGKS